MNINFEYLYRDAGNNKIWGSVVFLNQKNMRLEECDYIVRSKLVDESYFDGKKSTLPKLSFDKFCEEIDHQWYEFFSMKYTDEKANDKFGRDISEFIDFLENITKVDRASLHP